MADTAFMQSYASARAKPKKPKHGDRETIADKLTPGDERDPPMTIAHKAMTKAKGKAKRK